MEKHIEKFILEATSKALATQGNHGINVVPVSTIRVVDGNIWLINYFMDKTLHNISYNKNVALVCWSKMMGYQIKGEMEIVTDGKNFDEAVMWVGKILPERVVKGLLILHPKEVFDVSPTKNTKETFIPEIT